MKKYVTLLAAALAISVGAPMSPANDQKQIQIIDDDKKPVQSSLYEVSHDVDKPLGKTDSQGLWTDTEGLLQNTTGNVIKVVPERTSTHYMREDTECPLKDQVTTIEVFRKVYYTKIIFDAKQAEKSGEFASAAQLYHIVSSDLEGIDPRKAGNAKDRAQIAVCKYIANGVSDQTGEPNAWTKTANMTVEWRQWASGILNKTTTGDGSPNDTRKLEMVLDRTVKDLVKREAPIRKIESSRPELRPFFVPRSELRVTPKSKMAEPPR